MNSFVDAHTPSESPEASSSESSTGGDWESGEFKTNEQVDWKSQRKLSKPKLSINKLNATTPAKLSHHQFKSKSSSVKLLNNNTRENVRKMRWLSNMRSDPDFRQTFVNSVNIQARQSIDSLDKDYYSEICDNQLSVGSPNKCPNDLTNMKLEAKSDHKHTNSRHQSRFQLHTNHNNNNNNHHHHHHHHHNHHHNNHNHHHQPKQMQQQQQEDEQQTHSHHTKHNDTEYRAKSSNSTTQATAINDCPVLVVAKPIESQSIGFNVENSRNANENASGKLHCDKLNSNGHQLDETLINANRNVIDESINTATLSNHSDRAIASEESLVRSNEIQKHVNASPIGKSPSRSKINSFFKMHEHVISPQLSFKQATNSTESSSSSCNCSNSTSNFVTQTQPIAKKLPFIKIKTESKKSLLTNWGENDLDSGASSVSPSDSCKMHSDLIVTAAKVTISPSSSMASASTSASATASTSSSLLPKRKRSHRYPPFTFREIRNELRSVMKQNSLKKC